MLSLTGHRRAQCLRLFSYCLFLLIFLASKAVQAAQCSAYFPRAAQSHSSSGSLKFKDSGSIDGDTLLTYKNLTDETDNSHNTCTSQDCNVTGSQVNALTLPGFLTTKSKNEIKVEKTEVSTVGPGGDSTQTELKKLTVTDTGSLTFLSSSSPYRIKLAEFVSDASITLSAGEYWFDELKIADRAQIIVTGAVVIYVKKHLDITGDSKLNINGSANNLVIVGYDVVHFKDSVQAHAVVYAKKEARLEADTRITGSISSTNLEIKDRALLTDEAVDGVSIGSLCSAGGAAGIHHYQIDHDGSGSTCAAETITIKACADATCNSLSSESVSLNVLVGGVTENSPTFTGSTSISFNRLVAGDVSLSLDAASVVAENPDSCQSSGDASCQMTFSSLACNIMSCGDIFADVAQSNDSRGELKFSGTGTIDGVVDPGLALSFPKLTVDNSVPGGHQTCTSGMCDINEQNSSALSLSRYITTNNKDKLTVSTGEVVSMGSGGDVTGSEFESLKVEDDGQLTLLASNTSLKAKFVSLTGTAKLTLEAGEYWFEDLAMSDSSQLLVTGPVRLYVKSNMNIVGDSQLNPGGSVRELVLINYAQANFKDDSKTNAVIYSVSTVTLEGQAQLTGAVASKKLEIKDTAKLSYADVSGVSIGGMCRSSLDHLEIVHDGVGLSCLAETVTLKACANSSCSLLSLDPLQADLQLDNFTVTSPTFTGTTEVDINHYDGGTVTLSLTNESVVPLTTEVCSGNPGNSCDMAFAEAGLVVTVNDSLSCGSQNITLKAVKLSDTGVSCAPAYTGVQPIDILFNYAVPASGTRVPQLAGSDMATAGDQQRRDITFDANGETALPLVYNDAGSLSFTVSEGQSSGLTTGSDTAVFYPSLLSLSVTNSGGQVLNAATATGTPVQAAASQFNVAISAQCSDGSVTPNYQPSSATSTQLWVDRTGPVGSGTVDGLFTVKSGIDAVVADESPAWTTVDMSDDFSSGILSSATASYNEVGLLQVDVKDINYMGYAINSTGAVNVGRFVADHFTLDSSDITAACGSFSYMDQPFLASYQLSARNASGQMTQNYAGAFGGATLNYKLEDEGAGVELSSRLDLSPGSNWSAGVLSEVSLPVTLNRLATAEGPYAAANLGINVLDNDSSAVITLKDLDMDVSDVASCTGDENCKAKALGGNPLDLRYGQGQLFHSFGPQTHDLGVKLEAQYWNGQRFVWNALDNCSQYSSTDLMLTNGQKRLAASDVSIISPTMDTGVLSGMGTVLVAAPGAGKSGQVDIKADVPYWLKGYNSTNSLYDVLPEATLTFGQYRGNDRLVYWREVQ